MEQNIFDYLVEGLDLNAFYSFIDSKTDIDKNTCERLMKLSSTGTLSTRLTLDISKNFS